MVLSTPDGESVATDGEGRAALGECQMAAPVVTVSTADRGSGKQEGGRSHLGM